MKKIGRLVFCFILLLTGHYAMAQGGGTPPTNSFKPTPDFLAKMGEILPNAPNTAAIEKFGGIDIEMNTGVVKKMIQLRPFTSGKVSVPLSLGFSSMGLKVNEHPTRVGVGWHFSGAGLISRVIYGKDDLIATRYVPQTSIQPNEDDLYTTTFCVNLNYEGNRDASPDIFNYNFGQFSGKFIFENNGTIRPLLATNIKFFYNPSPQSSGEWKFKAITPDGTQYYFGASGAVESTKIGATRFFNDYIPNAWHLTKIVDPLGDVINFLYQEQFYGPIICDIEETHVSNAINCGVPTCPSIENPDPPNGCLSNNYETRYMSVKSQYLTEVNNTDGDKVLFTYSGQGYPELLLDSIRYYINGTSQIRKFELGYDYVNSVGGGVIPFLKSIVEKGAQGLPISQGYNFTYYSKELIPKRFSFSQDHWGFFNGKNNNTLIPVPEDLQIAASFPQATANREADSIYTIVGLLKEITYPTGGKDIITYESNRFSEIKDLNGYETLSQSVVGQQDFTYNSSSGVYFQIGYAPLIRLDMSSNYTVSGAPAPHPGGRIKIKNLSTNQIVYEKFISPPSSGVYSTYEFTSLSAGYYIMYVESQGIYVQTTCSLKKRVGLSANMQNVETVVGGVRLKKVLTVGYPDRADLIKRYYYGKMDNRDKSSALFYTKPSYYSTFNFIDGVVDPTCLGLACSVSYQHSILNSSSLSRLFTADGKILQYTSVIESYGGENFQNGAIEHKFSVVEDSPPQTIRGSFANLFSPFSNSSVYNMGEIETTNYKIKGDSLVKASTKIFDYFIDTRKTIDSAYYFVGQRGPLYCRVINSNNMVIGPYPIVHQNYDINKYYLTSVWKYLKSEKEYQYDENGTNPVVTQVDYTYDDLNYLTLTKRTFTNSKGEILTENFTYPHNNASGSPYGDMVARNMVETVIEQVTSITNSQYLNKELSRVKTNYAIWPGNSSLSPSTFISPSSVEKSIEQNTLTTELVINNYDNKGNILQTTSKKDGVVSYVWGYKQKYPVAKIFGKSYSDVIAQSGINEATLNTSTMPDEQVVQTEVNKLRQLVNCQVTTSTYRYPYGISRSSDLNAKNTYYDYDQFGRLIHIRDHDQNILKKFCYKYNGQIENCAGSCVSTAANWVSTGNIRCQQSNCAYTGYQEYEQTDNNPCSPTYNQTQWLLGGYNPSACSGSSGGVNITYQNNVSYAMGFPNSVGWVITYTHRVTGAVYSFSIPSSGTGSLGCIPAGSYTITVSRPNNSWLVLFNIGCLTTSGTSATFGKVSVSSTSCNTIILSDDML
jgi:hypothetical protein